ncbi:proheparin-binding EGF-like growth factor [Pseudophryne corroboree]|uniref:proheparin-binding EGF-like growth factor n=1 Tax=Pseudophryne corroboree TaxID=495146 RepID=UPI003081A1C0
MKVMKILVVILIEGLISFDFLYGAVIGNNQNEVFNKATDDFSAVAERLEYNDKPHFPNGNHIVALSRAAHSSKPQEMLGENKGRKGRKKGKGLKRDPCQRKYKDFCIHGECRYLKVLKEPSCVCQAGYHGERCHALILPLENPSNTYDHTTVLAVVAVVLSSFCLIVISSLLILRYHKRGAYNVENEEKLKFGSPT